MSARIPNRAKLVITAALAAACADAGDSDTASNSVIPGESPSSTDMPVQPGPSDMNMPPPGETGGVSPPPGGAGGPAVSNPGTSEPGPSATGVPVPAGTVTNGPPPEGSATNTPSPDDSTTANPGPDGPAGGAPNDPSNGGEANGPANGGAPGGGGPMGGEGPGPGPVVTVEDGPCDIYEADGAPCVGAYSTVRRIYSAYDGPLYQVRSNSNPENTGSGGETHDVGMTPEGYADADAADAACGGTTCTVSLLYDQSGRGNHLPVAKGGLSNGGQFAALDDFESIADEEEQMVGGHRVYPLYMEARQGYRLTHEGEGVPLRTEPQALYLLADGTHYGTACCWDFGNVSPDPTRYGVMNTLLFGTAFWGRGAGNGPWFMADFEAGVWAGGSNPGDPGWGALNDTAPPNENNPSLPVPHAVGFLKTDPQIWSLRMADVAGDSVTTAYVGDLPKAMNNEGAIVIGVGGDNSNNSWGTFFEGAVMAGFPSDEAEEAVLQNIKAAGYGQ